MMDSEEEKQNYLRENILDKGYDAEDFVTFLTSKKQGDEDEGVDLGNWSLNELKMVVQQYILTHPIPKAKVENNIQPTTQQYNPLQNPISSQNSNFSQNMNLNMNNNINNFNNMGINNNQNMNMGMVNNQNMNMGMVNNQNMNMGMVNNQNMNMGMMNNQNMNMGMNQNINMGIGMNQALNMGMNNPISNNYNTTSMNDNLNHNYMSFTPETGLMSEHEEQTDVYGITNFETILCSISEKSEMSRYENIHIEMTLGEKVPRTFFTKAYMTFIITTSPINLKVKRRYSDFEWLRQILLSFYSSSVIPPIPKKNKIGGDRFDETFLLKRIRTLEKFLNFLMEDPVIRVSQILYDFLSIEEPEKFAEKKKYYNNFKLPLYLRDYKSPTGKLDIAVNEEREIIYQNIKDHIELNQELLSKLNKNLKLLNGELSVVINRMDEISKNCEDLFLNSVKYCDANDIKISYYQLNDLFKHWSTTLKKNATLINVNIREYFKYTKNTYRSMKELLNVVDNYKQNYYKSKRNLITKKEDLFKKSDVSKWDLGPNKDMNVLNLLKDKNVALPKMLCSETNVVINLKQLYGYYLNSANNEYERIKKLTAFGHRQNISDNSKKEITIISELFKNISEIAVGSQKYDIKNIEKEINQKYSNETTTENKA